MSLMSWSSDIFLSYGTPYLVIEATLPLASATSLRALLISIDALGGLIYVLLTADDFYSLPLALRNPVFGTFIRLPFL